MVEKTKKKVELTKEPKEVKKEEIPNLGDWIKTYTDLTFSVKENDNTLIIEFKVSPRGIVTLKVNEDYNKHKVLGRAKALDIAEALQDALWHADNAPLKVRGKK